MASMPHTACELPQGYSDGKQTVRQQRYCDKWNLRAEGFADSALTQLLRRLASPEVQTGLRDLCPSIDREPSRLLHQLQSELLVTEHVHAPQLSSIKQLANRSYLALEAEERVCLSRQLRTRSVSPKHVQDRAEVGLFGLPPLIHDLHGTPDSGQAAPLLQQARERLIYAQLNLLSIDVAAKHGPFAMVLRPTLALRRMTLMTPCDSGAWEMVCNNTPGNPSPLAITAADEQDLTSGSLASCEPWRPTDLATGLHYTHLFVPWARMHSSSNGVGLAALPGPDQLRDAHYPDILVQFFARRCRAPHPAPEHYVFPIQLFRGLSQYWEANVIGHLQYPSDVKFIIAKFVDLFGTPDGARLQYWCVSRGWALVWALGAGHSLGDRYIAEKHSGARHGLNDRLIDPLVALLLPVKVNASVPDRRAVVASFNSLWQRGKTMGQVRRKQVWLALWAEFREQMPPSFAVRPLRAGDCEDSTRCIGTTFERGRPCVCYANNA